MTLPITIKRSPWVVFLFQKRKKSQGSLLQRIRKCFEQIKIIKALGFGKGFTKLKFIEDFLLNGVLLNSTI